MSGTTRERLLAEGLGPLAEFRMRGVVAGSLAFAGVAALAWRVTGANDWLRNLVLLWTGGAVGYLVVAFLARYRSADPPLGELVVFLALALLAGTGAAMIAAWMFAGWVGAPMAHPARDAALAAAFVAALTVMPVLWRTREWRRRYRAEESHAQVRERDRHEHAMTQARLATLQAQVEPHFLYNTLANAQALVKGDPDSAERMLGHLIDYLRTALPQMRASASTLGREVALATSYLDVMQLRMGPRLTYVVELPESLRDRQIPPMMLMSLVENAVKHGIEPETDGGTITISAVEDSGRLTLAVADTGAGFGDATGGGIGLSNLQERLRMLYGDRGSLDLAHNHPSGVTATLTLPQDSDAQSADR